jgi:hypothetical protein
MSKAAKTTPSTHLKLKEAQEEFGELNLALAKQKASQSSNHPQAPSNPQMQLLKNKVKCSWKQNLDSRTLYQWMPPQRLTP